MKSQNKIIYNRTAKSLANTI